MSEKEKKDQVMVDKINDHFTVTPHTLNVHIRGHLTKNEDRERKKISRKRKSV